MVDHRNLIPAAAATALLLSAPVCAAEPFAMNAADVSPDAAAAPSRDPNTPFRMFASDIVYSGTDRADDAEITRSTDQAVTFEDQSSAANAQIVVNEGGAARFLDGSTAENGGLTVNGDAGFAGNATAGSATIVVNAAGQTVFTQSATAGGAALTNNGALSFTGNSSGGSASITNNESGAVVFSGDADAGAGLLTNSGATAFHDRASAGGRFVANNETGRIAFAGASSAGNAVLGNSGVIAFGDASTLADGRIIGNLGSAVEFSGTASAGEGEIAHAGTLRFSDRSSAGTALIETQTGGATYFSGEASGGLAEMRLQDGSVLDFSGLTSGRTSVGSLLGTGRVLLGGTALTVGGNDLSTTVANIADGGVAGGTGGSLVKVGQGTLRLEGANTYTGSTIVTQGTLQAASAGAFAPRSSVRVDEGAVFDIAGFDQEIGSLAGSGAVDLAANRLTLGGDGRSTRFGGLFTGSGSFDKRGAGIFIIAGTSENFGASLVSEGTLDVTGTLPLLPLIIQPGATLTGSGTLGSVVVRAGSTVAPRGTLAVEGDAELAANSVLAVQAAADGSVDRLDVGETARLEGGSVRVTALDRAVSYRNGQRFEILRANVREGEFAGVGLASETAFLLPSLAYEGGAVSLLLTTTAQDSEGPPLVFTPVAQTPNQTAAARALDGLAQTGESLALYNAILLSDLTNARIAFDQLSGELHPGVQGALAQTGGLVRASLASRLEDLLSVPAQGADRVGAERFLGEGVWGRGFGSLGTADGQVWHASFDHDTSGLLLGTDRAIGATGSFGLFAGYGRTAIDTRNAEASVDSLHGGAYGAAAHGPFEFTGGAALSFNDVATERTVAFSNLAESLSAGYDIWTAQIFGEIGYRSEIAGTGVKPFVGLSHLHLDTDAFAETGGVARLHSPGATQDTSFFTTGLRANRDMMIGGRLVQARGLLGWRHAFGDRTPNSTLAFVSGVPFNVSGPVLSREAALIEAGLTTGLGSGLSLGIDYIGQFGSGTSDNGFRFDFTYKF